MSDRERVLVTGAGGYIGSNVVITLLDLDYDVVAVGFDCSNIDERAIRREEDIFKISGNLYEYFDHPDICIHLAWRNGFDHNNESHIDDLPKHLDFLTRLIDDGVRHLSVMGSMHEVGYHVGAITSATPTNPESFYGIAKDTLRRSLEVVKKSKPFIFQWLRAYYILGQDERNHSIFTKIREAAIEGKTTFPFTSGTNQYDFITVENLALEIALASTQDKIQGIINCATGKPISLKDRVSGFIKDNKFEIALDYGAFPDRDYDSPIVYGEVSDITEILTLAEPIYASREIGCSISDLLVSLKETL